MPNWAVRSRRSRPPYLHRAPSLAHRCSSCSPVNRCASTIGRQAEWRRLFRRERRSDGGVASCGLVVRGAGVVARRFPPAHRRRTTSRRRVVRGARLLRAARRVEEASRRVLLRSHRVPLGQKLVDRSIFGPRRSTRSRAFRLSELHAPRREMRAASPDAASRPRRPAAIPTCWRRMALLREQVWAALDRPASPGFPSRESHP